MADTNKQLDAYIAQSPAFAQPILQHLRQLVHKACPRVTESMKWGMPFFEYHGNLCSMAAFKQHCAFSFWKAALMSDPHGLMEVTGKTAMGHFGQIRERKDLPADRILIAYIKEAARLNESGAKVPARTEANKTALEAPEDLRKALSRNKAAREVFEQFSYTNKKEYIDWITEAKTGATRSKRLATAVEWMAEGKIRHWKYIKK